MPDPIGGKTVRIPLTNGGFTLVDAADYELVSACSWRNAGGYAATGRCKDMKLLHRLLLKAPAGRIVDHKNRDGLDNRRSNLRLCTHAQNMRNRRKHRDTRSTYKGVHQDPRTGRWRAQITHDGSRKHLGLFDDEIQAALQYDVAARRYHGPYAATNASLALL